MALLRWALVVIFLWFGCMKFTGYEAHGIAPLMMNSPIMSWLPATFGVQGASHVIGVLELSTAPASIIGAFNVFALALGAAMSCVTYLITLSFLLSTPGVAEPKDGWLSVDIGGHRPVPAQGSGALGRLGLSTLGVDPPASRLARRTLNQSQSSVSSSPGNGVNNKVDLAPFLAL